MLPIRTLDFLSFDPTRLPEGYVRFVRAATTAGVAVFASAGVYGYVMLDRTLARKATDIEAVLLLMKAAFLFVLTGASAAMAVVLGIISIRCWLHLRS